MFENMRHLTEEERKMLNDMYDRLNIEEFDFDEKLIDQLNDVQEEFIR